MSTKISKAPFTPADKPRALTRESPYSHVESHHIIRFKAPPTVTKPRHSTRQEARRAVKKRLNNSSVADTSIDTSSTITTSKLKSGNESTRGRKLTRNKSLTRLARSISSIRSTGRGRSKSRTRNSIHIISSGASVSSQRSSKSIKSLKDAGSNMLKKVKSFKRSKSLSGRSVNSTSSKRSFFSTSSRRSFFSTSSRRSFFGWRRRKNKNGSGEEFVFTPTESTPAPVLKKRVQKKKSGGFMGLFCGALEPMCGTLLCGENTNEEDIVGKVIGFDGAPNATPDTSIEHDEDDPRIM